MKNQLIWHEEGRETVFTCSIFNVEERYCRPPEGKLGFDGPRRGGKADVLKTFTVLNAPDWVIVIPVIDSDRGREFVMVRQWRHGDRQMSLEFPGGVFESGENAATAAARELREETGYTPHTIEKLGEFNPNPAIMSNRVHFFLAKDLSAPAGQNLDEDEYVEVEIVPWKDVLEGLGKAPYIHALMGTAMALYLQHQNNIQ
jgi:8-oxo-dGTP pyrophosphatase MutT (NUDIX family)